MHGARSARVAITGIGIVSPLGCAPLEYWERLSGGESAIGPLDAAYTRHGAPLLGATVNEAFLKAVNTSPRLRRMDNLSRMVVAAARAALADARLDREQLTHERVGVAVGSSVGNLSETNTHLERLCTRGPGAASPLIFPNLVLNAPASYVSMDIGATGPNLTVSQLEASGECAIIAGADLIRDGHADVAVVGGADELSTIALHVYREARALSSQRGGREWSSPYDRDRNGIILGEGSAMLVLEPLQRAVARGATVYAEIERDVLFAVPTPPYAWPLHGHDVAAHIRTILPAGEHAGAVDLAFGAANSSRHLDRIELEVFTELFGHDAARTWLTSIKGATGEFAASGALTTATAALALHSQTVPPLCNLHEREAGIPFRIAAPRAVAAPLDRVLVAGLARGGAGAALLLARANDASC